MNALKEVFVGSLLFQLEAFVQLVPSPPPVKLVSTARAGAFRSNTKDNNHDAESSPGRAAQHPDPVFAGILLSLSFLAD